MVYLLRVIKNCSEFSCSQLVLHKLQGECAHLCRRRRRTICCSLKWHNHPAGGNRARRAAAAATTTTLLYRYHLPFSPFAWLRATRCAWAGSDARVPNLLVHYSCLFQLKLISLSLCSARSHFSRESQFNTIRKQRELISPRNWNDAARCQCRVK